MNCALVFNADDTYAATSLAELVKKEFGLPDITTMAVPRSKPVGYFEVVLMDPSLPAPKSE
jgi:hypothetical protein